MYWMSRSNSERNVLQLACLVERDLFTARLAEVQARNVYAKARIALDQAMGVTLTANHVDLDEALRGVLTTAPTPSR